ncbi:MAG: hypothetical protein HYZ75_03010 [Elusimicrobia bacterium]|nr:hypothetical protein [Elusimicrobiota bacterium]
MEEDLDPAAQERWSRLSKRLFAAPPADPAFTARIMARIEAEAPRGLLERLFDSLQPAPMFGLAAVAAALIIMLAGGAETVGAEDLLLADAGEGATAWLASPAAPEPDDLLAMALERR